MHSTDYSTVDGTIPRTPFDSTPFDFDSQIFLEVMLRGTLFPGDGPNPGEEQSPLPGEFRLLSDPVFDRGNETASRWQENACTSHPALLASL